MKRWNNGREALDKRWRLSADDGLAVTIFKVVAYGPAKIWKLLFLESYLRITDKSVSHLCECLYGEVTDKQRRTVAIDSYKLFMNCILIAAFLLITSITTHQLKGVAYSAVCILCVLFSIGRLGEILSLVAVLAFDEDYRSKGFARPIVNTLWHFCEVSIVYASIYATVSYWNPDCFGINKYGAHLGDSISAPWYLSFATLSTMGYFDYAPMTFLPRLLVASEVLCGYFLILVVLQRSFSSFVKESKHFDFFNLRWGPDNVLVSKCGRYNIGVIVIVQDTEGNLLIARKAAKEGYEFSGKLCFPGGLVRKHTTSDFGPAILQSAVDRVLSETGLDLQSKRLIPFSVRQNVATRYTKNGESKTTLVLAYFYQLAGKPSTQLSSDDSVESPMWMPMPSSLVDFSPANAVYAYAYASPALPQSKRELLLDSIQSHVTYCNHANIAVGLQPIDLDSLGFV